MIAVGQPMVAADLATTVLAVFPLTPVGGFPVAGQIIFGAEIAVSFAFVALGLAGPGNGPVVVGPNTFIRLSDPSTPGSAYITPVPGTVCRVPTRWQQSPAAAAVNLADAQSAANASLSGFTEIYGATFINYTRSSGPGPENFAAIALAAGR